MPGVPGGARGELGRRSLHAGPSVPRVSGTDVLREIRGRPEPARGSGYRFREEAPDS